MVAAVEEKDECADFLGVCTIIVCSHSLFVFRSFTLGPSLFPSSHPGPLSKLGPKYMSKRPLLTIEIPSRMERLEREESAVEVSCFSPCTSDEESCGSESILSSAEDQKDSGDDRDSEQDTDKVLLGHDSDDEVAQQDDIRMLPFGSRWSRRFQQNRLPSIITQAHRTPTRRKVSSISVSPFSPMICEHLSRSPSQGSGHPPIRRTSNPFDYLTSHHRHFKIRSSQKTPTRVDIRPVTNQISPSLKVPDCYITPKILSAPTWRSTTC